MAEPTVALYLRVPADLARAFDEKATATGKSKNQAAIEAIEAWIRKENGK